MFIYAYVHTCNIRLSVCYLSPPHPLRLLVTCLFVAINLQILLFFLFHVVVIVVIIVIVVVVVVVVVVF